MNKPLVEAEPVVSVKLKIRFQSAEARMAGVDLEKLLGNPQSGCQKGDLPKDAILFKEDRATTLYRMPSAVGDLMVKRYNTKNLWHLLRRNFQVSRARNCLEIAEKYSDAGIRVAQPVAMIESRMGPFAGRSWYISRFVDSVMLSDYLDRENWAVPLQSIQGKITALFEIFRNHALSHGDMKATNLLVHDDDLVVIDLDSAKQHGWKFLHRIALQRDKARFLNNWNDQPLLYRHLERELAHIGL